MRGAICKLGLVLLTCALGIENRAAWAEDQPVDFLHALQKGGMGETAREYLEFLQKKKEVPSDLKDTVDLEMSTCLRSSATEASTPDEEKRRLAAARTYLDKFLKEHPTHPKVADALQADGTYDFRKGMETLAAAKGADKPEEQKRLAEEARKLFQNAITRLQPAADNFTKQMAAIKADIDKNPVAKSPAAQKPGKRVTQRAAVVDPRSKQLLELTLNWLEAQGTVGFLNFQIAQTYFDPKDSERRKMFGVASKEFYKVKEFAQLEGAVANAPEVMLAKLWEGRTQLELGNLDGANDIFDECEIEDKDLPKLAANSKIAFPYEYSGQVAYSKMLAKIKEKDLEVALAQGKAWRADHPSWIRVPGYQGVTLEMAKVLVELAEKNPANATANNREALALLTELTKTPGEYSAEALKLKASIGGKLGGDKGLEVKTFADALAVARDEARMKHWPQALEMYEKTLKLGEREKDQAPLADVRKEHALAQFFLLEQEYSAAEKANDANKMTDIMARAEKLSTAVESKSPVASSAAGLAVGVALWLYNKADKAKEAEAGDKVIERAKAVINNWPNSAGGGKAALYLASIYIRRGNLEAATKALEGLNENSPMYGDAMETAAKLHWNQYVTERRKPAAERDQALLKAQRDATLRCTASGATVLTANQSDAKVAQQVVELRLLETQALLDSGDAADIKKARKSIESVGDRLKSGQLNETSLKIAVMTVRACVKDEDFAQAAKIGELLLKDSGDDPAANTALVGFVLQVNGEVKKARIACSEAELSPDPKVLERAKAKLKQNEDLIRDLLVKLSGRANLQPNEQLFLADLCSEIGLAKEASKIYDDLVGKVEGKQKIAIQSKLVGLLRQQGSYEEAYKQVSELLRSQVAMEPLLEKGRILQDWAERDLQKSNDARRYELAANYWGNTRNNLGRMQPRPPEYFDVIYNEAYCLLKQAKAPHGDKAKADEASKLLETIKVRSPQLSGPEMVAKYDALIADCNKVLGITAAPASGNANK